MTDFSRWDTMVVARRFVHLDGTPCAGSRCAWKGDGGHIVRDPGGGYVPSWVERRISDIEYGKEEARDEAASIAAAKHWGVHFFAPTLDEAIKKANHVQHPALTGDWQTGDSWAAWGEPVDTEPIEGDGEDWYDTVHVVLFFRADNPEDAKRIGTEIMQAAGHPDTYQFTVTTAAMYSAQLS